jgi:hypothetical protein
MATHTIKVNLPERPLANDDARFKIFRNKEKLGEIRISRGSFDYYPSNKQKPIRIRWYQLDQLLQDWQLEKKNR